MAREQFGNTQFYFATLRTPIAGPGSKLRKVARTQNCSSLEHARLELAVFMSAAKSMKREGAVGTIFRHTQTYTGSETIEHAVIVNGEIRQAYRSSLKWYTDVAPWIQTSNYFMKPGLPPFRKDHFQMEPDFEAQDNSYWYLHYEPGRKPVRVQHYVDYTAANAAHPECFI